MTTEQKALRAVSWQRWVRKQPPEWTVWRSMKRRCLDRKHEMYCYYGGRGITICPEWLGYGTGFPNFLRDVGSKPSQDYSLDRKDPDKGYNKENCRWLVKSVNFASSRGCFKRTEEAPF